MSGPPRSRLGRDYWRLLSASTAANLGDGLMAVAVVWLASSLTRDPLWITAVTIASRLPWLVFSLPAGVITDRFDRRRIVAAMDALRCLLVAAFAVVVLAHDHVVATPEDLAAGAEQPAQAMPLLLGLCALALFLGFAEVLRDNTAQTLMPSIVDARLLEKANGRMWGAEMATNQFIGPPLAGFLVAIAAFLPFGVNAALLALSAALMVSLRGDFAPGGVDAAGGSSTRRSWRADLAEGFTWLWRHTLLRTLALLLGAMNMLSAVAMTLFVYFAQDVLGLFDGWQFGLLMTGSASGALLGSLLAEKISARLGISTSLRATLLVTGLGYGAIGLLSAPLAVWAVSVVIGVTIMLWNVITVSLRQRIIPDRLLGRVNAVYRFFGWGTISVGTLLGGVLVTVLESPLGREWALRTPLLVVAVISLVLLGVVRRRIGPEQVAVATRGEG